MQNMRLEEKGIVSGLMDSIRTTCILAVGFLMFAVSMAQGALVLVEDGLAKAIVVTADEATETALYAVDELVEHVKKATGVRLPVAAEAEIPGAYESRIYVGITRAAADVGIDAERFGPDEFILLTVDGDLYVLGMEDPERDLRLDEPKRSERHILDTLDRGHWPMSKNGTLFGVYEVLQRFVGVRWLWPGELGTYVPRSESLVIDEELDEFHEPALKFRRFRSWGVYAAAARGAADEHGLLFSEDGMVSYWRDLCIYMSRHRLGQTEAKPRVGHYFSGWWQRYGEENPEWFMVDEEGRRGHEDPNLRHVAVCVSNPDLHKYIVEEAWDGGDVLRLGGVDRTPFCLCPDCLSWDDPQPEDGPYSTTHRHARFWKTIYDMAVKRNPDVQVTAFLYWHYFKAPSIDIDLSGIYGEFVPWGRHSVWYPADEERLAWQRRQWRGWSETGISLAYRPNHTLAGYAMPHINTHQAGEFFRFAYRHGMIGADFDSFTGQWAVRGPENYMYMRLFADPEQEVDSIRDEYFSAFGPAAQEVERYFDYWEGYNHELREEGQWSNMYNNPVRAPGQYPPEVFPPAEAILERALEAAEDHREEYAERVRFLQAGLEHARLSAQFIDYLSGSLPVYDPDRFNSAKDHLERLTGFRREHEHLYIADYTRLAHLERRRFSSQIDQLAEAEKADDLFHFDLDGLELSPVHPVEPDSSYSFSHARVRRRANFVLYAEGGDQVKVLLNHRPYARSPRPAPPIRVVVSDSSGNVVHRDEVAYAQERELSFQAPETGFYRLTGTPGGHYMSVRSSSHPINIYVGEQRVRLLRSAGDYYFGVPAGTKNLAVEIAGWGSERMQGKLINPKGEVVAHKDNVSTAPELLEYEFDERTIPREGEIWLLRIDRASGDYHYYTQHIGLSGVPPLLAPSRDAVFRIIK